MRPDLHEGEFLNWLDANTGVHRNNANKYMKLATEYPSLIDLNYAAPRNLSVSVAFELLGAPDSVKEEVQNRLDESKTGYLPASSACSTA
jgi:hypothetical protein